MAADLAQRAVERLDCVSRVDDFTDLWRVVEEGRQLIPSLFPAPADRGKTGIENDLVMTGVAFSF